MLTEDERDTAAQIGELLGATAKTTVRISKKNGKFSLIIKLWCPSVTVVNHNQQQNNQVVDLTTKRWELKTYNKAL